MYTIYRATILLLFLLNISLISGNMIFFVNYWESEACPLSAVMGPNRPNVGIPTYWRYLPRTNVLTVGKVPWISKSGDLYRLYWCINGVSAILICWPTSKSGHVGMTFIGSPIADHVRIEPWISKSMLEISQSSSLSHVTLSRARILPYS